MLQAPANHRNRVPNWREGEGAGPRCASHPFLSRKAAPSLRQGTCPCSPALPEPGQGQSKQCAGSGGWTANRTGWGRATLCGYSHFTLAGAAADTTSYPKGECVLG